MTDRLKTRARPTRAASRRGARSCRARKDAGFNDALYAADTEGPGKALPKLFYLPPVGSEVCSPAFTPDGKTLFISIQHPGELRLTDGEDAESMADASTNWPDIVDGQPPRPSLVVISKDDGDVIGS